MGWQDGRVAGAQAPAQGQAAWMQGRPAGGPGGAPQDKVWQPLTDYANDVTSAFQAPIRQYAEDQADVAKRAQRPMWKEIALALPDAVVDAYRTGRIGMQAIGALASPITSIPDALVAAPVARGMEKIAPTPSVAAPKISLDQSGVHLTPPRVLSPDEVDDFHRDRIANVRSGINTALATVMPLEPKAMGAAAAARAAMALPAEQARGLAYVRRLAEAQKATPDTLAAASPNLTAAEAIGQNAEDALGALARRPGDTSKGLRNLVDTRRAERGSRVLNVVTDATGIDPRAVSDLPAMADSHVAATATFPEAQIGSGALGAHTKLNALRDASKGGVDAAYAAAREAQPESAVLNNGVRPAFKARMFDAIRDFAPAAAPQTRSILGAFDDLSRPVTARDLFDMRSQLTNLRFGMPSPETAAASAAIKAIDGGMSEALDAGHFSGDPSVIGAWRDAIAKNRQHMSAFEGEDLIHGLTARDWRGGQLTNVVAPEDASRAIFGQSGVSARANGVRDLTRLRDVLGADSPEWKDLQHEAFTRIMSGDIGKETFGASWDKFSKQNPRLADLLANPDTIANMESARSSIADAVHAKHSHEIAPQQLFDKNISAAQFKALVDGTDDLGRQAGRAGIANRINNIAQGREFFDVGAFTAPHVRAKLVAAYGQAAADKIMDAVKLEQSMRDFENTQGVKAGSRSAPWLAAMQEQDAVHPAVKAGVDLATSGGNPVKAAFSLLNPLDREALMKSFGMSQGARDAAGGYLSMTPQELADLVRKHSQPKPSPLPTTVSGVGAAAAVRPRGGSGRP